MRGCPFGFNPCNVVCRHFSAIASGEPACWYYRPAIRIAALGLSVDGLATPAPVSAPQQVVKIFVSQGVRAYVPQKPPVPAPIIPSKSTGYDVRAEECHEPT